MYRSVSLALSEEPPTAVNGNIYHANYECWTSGQTSSVLQRRGRERERKNRNSNTTRSSPPQRRRQPQTQMHVLSDCFFAIAADSVCRLVLSGCVCFAARQIVKHSVRLLLLAKWSTQTGRQTHKPTEKQKGRQRTRGKKREGREQVCVRRYLHHHCCLRTTLEYKLYHHHHSAEGQRKGGGEEGGGQSGPFRFCRRRFQEKKLFGRERSEGEEGKLLLLLTNCSNTDPQQTLPPPPL